MTRRIAKTRKQRIMAPRKYTDPQRGYLGTFQLLDSGFWAYFCKDGKQGITQTAKQARLRLESA